MATCRTITVGLEIMRKYSLGNAQVGSSCWSDEVNEQKAEFFGPVVDLGKLSEDDLATLFDYGWQYREDRGRFFITVEPIR